MAQNSSKPQSVARAMLLLYGTLALGIIQSVITFPTVAEQSRAFGGAAFVIGVQSFTFLILGLLFYCVGSRRNWARILLLVLTAIGAVFSIRSIRVSFNINLISGLLGSCQILMQVAALVLLFLPASNKWYRKQVVVDIPSIGEVSSH
jgi:hypothetical protein